MSCIIAPIPGGHAGIFPLPLKIMDDIAETGAAIMGKALGQGVKKMKPAGEQYIGISRRPDGTPFYLTTFAPFSFQAAQESKTGWSGAFYVPLGYGYLVGTVAGETVSDTQSAFTVKARLYVGDEETVAAKWRVLGPNAHDDTPNRMALIDGVEISEKGPHMAEDMRKCIALHAPQAAWGEPKAVVAQQCGVAVACMIEAIC